jgi:hypothetical protein
MLLIGEVLIAAYLTLVVWLLSVWHVDDFLAAGMAPSDWYVAGASRLGGALIVAALFGGVAYLANRRWVAPCLPGWPRLGTLTAVVLASCVVLAGGAGAIQFVITKPFF